MLMDLSERSNEFLGSEEKVISSLRAYTLASARVPARYELEIFVTNWRLLFLEKTEDDKTRIFHDFDYKHISHIHCESTVGSDYRTLGIISIVLGLLIIAMGYGYWTFAAYGTIAFFLGIIFIILGILAILSKPKPKSVFKIDIVGISNPITFTLATSASQMDPILRPLAEMREKTTLRHDPITLSEEATK